MTHLVSVRQSSRSLGSLGSELSSEIPASEFLISPQLSCVPLSVASVPMRHLVYIQSVDSIYRRCCAVACREGRGLFTHVEIGVFARVGDIDVLGNDQS